MSESVQLLRQTKLFGTLPDEALAQIAAEVEVVTVAVGETIFEKGSMGTTMYIICDGRVCIHDGELLLNYLETGDIFGEMAALDPEVRSASVTAVTRTTLYYLEHHALAALMAAREEINQAILHVLCRLLRARVYDLTEKHEYISQFNLVIAAAKAMETNSYEPTLLSEVVKRRDALGQLARVFQTMAHEVVAREQQLQQTVQSLRIEIDKQKQSQQVARIAGTDYFKQLRGQANDLRKLLEE